ncbi:unnamed protein product [Spirodela intermedia]|uniref:Uncharacterized protein n=1 Tax=Spirodela intermedia TaxID=51605 RepID=A0A7I8K4T6_SPIIN|nr:unnamed protein product [Spirodela intermedia]
MTPPRCGAAITNALLASLNPSPSSSSHPLPSTDTNPLLAVAISLVFLFRNFSPWPNSAPSSFRPRSARKMRGTKASPATRSPSTSPPSTTARTALAFSSAESLSEWLRPRLPAESFASWGIKPGTKTVHNLWLEVSLGETSLLLQATDGREDRGIDPSIHRQEQLGLAPDLSLLRTVQVASVQIRNARGELLVETHQLLSDGTIRSRRRPLSEKMKPSESVEEATSRAIREELGEGAVVRIVPGSYRTRVEERPSASYPGLPARYVLHLVDAEVEGVPQEGEFSTEESGESGYPQGALFVQRHFWKWIPNDAARDAE